MTRRRFQNGCLFRRGKVWAARWREDIIREDGTLGRIRRYATLGEMSKREAQKLLDRMLQPLNQGKQRPQSVMTFDQFVRERWVPAKMPMLNSTTLKLDPKAADQFGSTLRDRPNSAESYSSKLRNHVLPAFGTKRLNEITRWDVQVFLSEKLKQSHSAAHVRGMRATLSKILRAAAEWGFIEENFACRCQISGREPVKQHVHLNVTQVGKLVAALSEPCRSIVLVAVLTGLRIGEILALRWGRVDFLRGTISVEESYSRRFGPPKTRSSRRVVPMSAVLRQVLEELRARSHHQQPEDLVFTTDRGTPLNRSNLLNRDLHPTCKNLKLPTVSWHSFRHAHTTWHKEEGTHPRDAQGILGHSDINTTLNIYTHGSSEAQREAMERVASKLAGVLATNGHKPGQSPANRGGLVN